MNVDKLRDEKQTEDSKLEMVADYLESKQAAPTFDTVLGNGSTATSKTAKIQESEENFSTLNAIGFYGQATGNAGTAVARVSAEGELYIDFQHGNKLSTFSISLKDGEPRVIMSDDMKAAFKAELGIE